MIDAINKDFDLEEFFQNDRSLQSRIEYLHSVIAKRYPSIVRVAIAQFDHSTDLLKTFLNSAMLGVPIKAYQHRLSETKSLKALSQNGGVRVIDDYGRYLEAL